MEHHESRCLFFFFQAEDGIRDLVRSRGLGDVYKRQGRDIQNKRVLDAMRSVPRHEFVPEDLRSRAHEDLSLIHI